MYTRYIILLYAFDLMFDSTIILWYTAIKFTYFIFKILKATILLLTLACYAQKVRVVPKSLTSFKLLSMIELKSKIITARINKIQCKGGM